MFLTFSHNYTKKPRATLFSEEIVITVKIIHFP